MILGLLSFMLSAAATTAPLHVHTIYTPSGFDSESSAFVVVNGVYPNSCYSWGGAIVEHKDEFTHEISPKADISEGPCLKILIPFTEEVALGRLSTGTHVLRFLNGDTTYSQWNLEIE